MNKIIPLMIAIVVVAVIWLWVKGCDKKPGPDHTEDKVFVDSVVGMVKTKLASFQHVYDSVKAVNAVLQKSKDSLSGVIKEYKVDIRDKGADIQGLIDELNASEAVKDTLRAMSACDSLKAQFTTAKALVLGYMVSNDSLATLNSHIITQKDTIIGHLSNMFNEANSSLFEVSRKYSNLDRDYNRLNVKPKRFGIGLGIVGTVENGKPAVRPGVVVSYNFVRF
jgi:predicted S18 family serine protease